MNLLDNRGDIRVLNLRFMTGLQRIEAVNLFSYDQTEDERTIITSKLMEMKKMIRDSHSGRRATPEAVEEMKAEYRVRREVTFVPKPVSPPPICQICLFTVLIMILIKKLL